MRFMCVIAAVICVSAMSIGGTVDGVLQVEFVGAIDCLVVGELDSLYTYVAVDTVGLTIQIEAAGIEQDEIVMAYLDACGAGVCIGKYVYNEELTLEICNYTSQFYDRAFMSQFECLEPVSSAVSDPWFGAQWYLGPTGLNVTRFWEYTKGGESGRTNVVLIDTGFSLSGSSGEFVGANIHDYAGPDYVGHGSKLMQIMAAQHNGTAIAGIAPEAEYYVYSGYVGSAFDDQATIDAFTATYDLALANPDENYVVVTAIGFSTTNMTRIREVYFDIMDACVDLGNVLFVCASGYTTSSKSEDNHSVSYSAHPAAFSGDTSLPYSEGLDQITLAVGSYGISIVGDSSAYGLKNSFYYPVGWAATDTCDLILDLAAPGGGTYPGDAGSSKACGVLVTDSGYECYMFGTSPAAALAGGYAALLWDLLPHMGAANMKQLLIRHVDKDEALPWRPLIFADCGFTDYVPRTFEGRHSGHGYWFDYESYCPWAAEIQMDGLFPNGNNRSGGLQPDIGYSVVLGTGTLRLSPRVDLARYAPVTGGVSPEEYILISDGERVSFVADIEGGAVDCTADLYGARVTVSHDIVMSQETSIIAYPGDVGDIQIIAEAFRDTNNSTEMIDYIMDAGSSISLYNNVMYAVVGGAQGQSFGDIQIDGVISGNGSVVFESNGNVVNLGNIDISGNLWIRNTSGYLTISGDVDCDTLHVWSDGPIVLNNSNVVANNIVIHENGGSPFGVITGGSVNIDVADEVSIVDSVYGVLALPQSVLRYKAKTSIGSCSYLVYSQADTLYFEDEGSVYSGDSTDIFIHAHGASYAEIQLNQTYISGCAYAVEVQGVDVLELGGTGEMVGQYVDSVSLVNVATGIVGGVSMYGSKRHAVNIQGNSDVDISDIDVDSPVGSGIMLQSGSNAVIRSSVLHNCGTGVSVMLGATADVGTSASPGANELCQNILYDLVNFSTNQLNAYGNMWSGVQQCVCPPLSGMVLGSAACGCE